MSFNFSSAWAQIQSQSWPSRLVLDGDVATGGNVGDILAEVGVSLVEPWETQKYLSGIAYLGIDGHEDFKSVAQNMHNKGVFSVSADGSVGVAFIGSLNVCVGNTSNCASHNDKKWNDSLRDISILWGTVPDSLIRVSSPGGTFKKVWVYLTGTVVLVRLKEGPITVSNIVLPNIRLQFNGQLVGGIVDTKSTNILSTTLSDIAASRVCNVQVSGTNIYFQPIRENVPAQAAGYGSSRSMVNVQCRGVSQQKTLVTMTLTSASGNVVGDPTAIPMRFSGIQNDELVVKATMSETYPNCLSNVALNTSGEAIETSKWLDVTGSKAYQIMTVPKDSTKSDDTQNVYWQLCRRTNYRESLPIGTFTGSAILSITLN